MSNNSGATVSPYGRRVTLTRASIAAAAAEDHLLAPRAVETHRRADRVARVSTSVQILDRQTRALTEAGPGLDWTGELSPVGLSAATAPIPGLGSASLIGSLASCLLTLVPL